MRRLPRSPRLSGPGPHQSRPLWLFRLGRRSGRHFGDSLEFGQKLRPVLHQVPDDPRVPEKLHEVSLDDGQLQVLNTIRSGGDGPTYVSIHPSGRFLLVANYFGGSVAVLPILPDGQLGEPTGDGPPRGPPQRLRAHVVTVVARGRCRGT